VSQWTPEEAVAAGKKAAEQRAALRALEAMDPEEYLRTTFAKEKAKLAKALMDAAFGRGPWHELSRDKQLDALKTALAYAIGRPGTKANTVPQEKPAADENVPAEGLVIE
jgi:hypothetical protein